MKLANKGKRFLSKAVALVAAVVGVGNMAAARKEREAYKEGRRKTYELIKELSAKQERISEQPRRSFVKEVLATQDWTGQVYKVK